MRGTFVEATWQHDPSLYAPPKYRRACRYDAFVPEPVDGMVVTLSGDALATMSDAEAAIRDLNSRAAPALAPFARLLLRTESIASSKVEGMQVDARDLARAEANLDSGRKAGHIAVEILANIDAMQLAVEEAAAAPQFEPAHLTAIHAELMRVAPNASIAGKIRSEQNWIGGNDYNPCGADFVPPPPEHVGELVADLCAAVADEGLPPLVQAAVLHAQFETIHPFADGNGRTGRALVQVVLRRRGLAPAFVPPISVILARDRVGYIRGLADYRHGNVAEWVERFAVAAARAAALADQYFDAVTSLQEKWREQLRSDGAPREGAAAWALIDILPAHPVITVAAGVVAAGRTKPAVNKAVGQLEAAGVLAPITTSIRNRAWEATGLLDLITSLEDGTQPR